MRKFLLLLMWVPFFASCMTAPYTGRSQFILTSESEEAAMGLTAYKDALQAQPKSADTQGLALVEKVGKRIAAAAARPDFRWEFTLLQSKEVNAWCLPGGKVAFYEGIMPICRDETGIAVVMGHEVGHAIARHGGERVTQTALAEAGVNAASEWIGKQNPKSSKELSAALGLGINLGVLLPFSREHESEADHIGLILMAKAGYDPREAPKFWERMSAGQAAAPPQFLSTHPSNATRIQQLQGWIPEAMNYFEAAKRGETYVPPAKAKPTL